MPKQIYRDNQVTQSSALNKLELSLLNFLAPHSSIPLDAIYDKFPDFNSPEKPHPMDSLIKPYLLNALIKLRQCNFLKHCRLTSDKNKNLILDFKKPPKPVYESWQKPIPENPNTISNAN